MTSNLETVDRTTATNTQHGEHPPTNPTIRWARLRRAHTPTFSTENPCLTNQHSSGMPITSGLTLVLAVLL